MINLIHDDCNAVMINLKLFFEYHVVSPSTILCASLLFAQVPYTIGHTIGHSYEAKPQVTRRVRVCPFHVFEISKLYFAVNTELVSPFVLRRVLCEAGLF